MSVRSGLGVQVGAAPEVTYGTYVAPTRFLEFRSEGLTFNREVIRSEGIRKGSTVRRTGRWAVNKKGGGGPLSFELANKGFGLWLKHAMGESVISTPAGWTNGRRHRYTLGDLDDLSLTVQKGIPKTADGVYVPYTFLGCVVTDWELSVDVDGLVMFNVTTDAQDMSRAESLAAASFPANDELFSYQQVAITVDGLEAHPTSLSIRAGHGLKTDRYFIRQSPLKKRPLIAAMRDLGGSMTFEFETGDEVDRFLDVTPGQEVPIVVNVEGDEIDVGQSSYGLDVTLAKVRFDGDMVTAGGPDVLTVTAPFEVLDDGTNEPIVVDYNTTDLAD